MPDRVRSWASEPWRAFEVADGSNEWHISNGEPGTYVEWPIDREWEPNAKRMAECVNAMRGWSAPEGAVTSLRSAASEAERYLKMLSVYQDGQRDRRPQRIAQHLRDALAEFSRVSEPS